MQSLCTLRNHRRRWPRNTRYQAGAAPYLGRTFTGRNAPACGWRTRSITIKGEQEYPKQVTLTITERGYHDDAVEGVVKRYRLEQSSDGWRITRAEEKQLKWPGY